VNESMVEEEEKDFLVKVVSKGRRFHNPLVYEDTTSYCKTGEVMFAPSAIVSNNHVCREEANVRKEKIIVCEE